MIKTTPVSAYDEFKFEIIKRVEGWQEGRGGLGSSDH